MNVILELGGNPARLNKAIEVYKQTKGKSIIVISSENNPELCVNMLHSAGINENYIFDYNAWDTLTNFTETYKYIMTWNLDKLFIVTDKFHMRRAITIAKNVYMFTGVDLVPCEFLGGDLNRVESDRLVFKDYIRSLIWKLFGFVDHDSKTRDSRMPKLKKEEEIAKQIAIVTP